MFSSEDWYFSELNFEDIFLSHTWEKSEFQQFLGKIKPVPFSKNNDRTVEYFES